ncbi:MAG TPA: hypothetical protein VIE88_11800, partial [Vicinamibacteria bacterium]
MSRRRLGLPVLRRRELFLRADSPCVGLSRIRRRRVRRDAPSADAAETLAAADALVDDDGSWGCAFNGRCPATGSSITFLGPYLRVYGLFGDSAAVAFAGLDH